uniref:Mitochondrial potassium channel ATP-binding subunit n=1 Tax=Romanomermis culicivorax TaxID=13658 RepID=A0A915IGS0_ROMCU
MFGNKALPISSEIGKNYHSGNVNYVFKICKFRIRNWKSVNSKTKNPCKIVVLPAALFLPSFFKKAFTKKKIKTSDRDRVSEAVNNEQRSKSQENFPWASFGFILRPYLLFLVAAVVTAIFAAVVNIQIPLQLGALVNVAAGIKDKTFILACLHRPAFRLLSLYGIQSLLTALYISLLSFVGEKVARDLRLKLFDSLLMQDIQFFDAKRTGELVARLSTDVQEFKSCFKQAVSQGLRNITQCVGCSVSLYFISPKMTLATLTVLPVVVLLGTVLGSFLRHISKQAQEQVALATAVASEALNNIRTVKAFAMEETEEKMYARELEKSRNLNEVLGIGVGIFQGLTNFVLNGIILSVIYGGSHLISSGEITSGQLMSFLVTAQVIQRSLAQVSLLFGQVIKGTSAGARVFLFIDRQADLDKSGNRIIPYHSLLGEVKFDNVSFTYPNRPDFTVLKDFALTIQPGQIVALCGHSGAGKSTVAALLERFYDVDSGSVTIDGNDVKNLDIKWLRGKAVGFISQEPVLFHTTIKENIRYGKPEATDYEVLEAAKIANADSFIRTFPDGYDTVAGERGVALSGGQKQRIAIARALLKNPPILILDEATSALDAESERLVQEALDRAEKGRTVLVIAHRLSTLQNADKIAVVSGNKIAEIGSHKELLKLKGLYWQLVQHQRSN